MLSVVINLYKILKSRSLQYVQKISWKLSDNHGVAKSKIKFGPLHTYSQNTSFNWWYKVISIILVLKIYNI